MISCFRESLCYSPICLHPTEIIVYILYRKSRDKLSSRIAVLFTDLPIPNRNRYYYLPICLHPIEIVVYILYRKSRDKLSSRIAVLFADLPAPNRNHCLHFISEVTWYVVFENRCVICRFAYTQTKSLLTFYIGSHVISCLRESLCYLPICLHPNEIVITFCRSAYPQPKSLFTFHIGSHVISCLRESLCYLPICLHPTEIMLLTLYMILSEVTWYVVFENRCAICRSAYTQPKTLLLFADLPAPNRNRCLHFISEVTWYVVFENRCAICRSAYTQPKSLLLFADLPTPNRNHCLHFISEVTWYVVFENRCVICRFAYTQTKSLLTFYIGSHVISCLRESLCYLPICLHPNEIVINILYRKSRDKLSSRIAVLFADLPTPNRNRY